jgi:hypothetical protein
MKRLHLTETLRPVRAATHGNVRHPNDTVTPGVCAQVIAITRQMPILPTSPDGAKVQPIVFSQPGRANMEFSRP